MATTVGVDRELRAPAPAVPGYMHHRRQVLLLLGTLTASVTFQAGLSPPNGLWFYNGGARIVDDPLLHTKYCQFKRYLVSLYLDATTFVVWLAVVLLLILPSRNQRIKLYALRAAMTMRLLCLFGDYVSVSSLSLITSIWVGTLAAAVTLYIAIQIPVLLCEPVEVSLSSVRESPQERPELLPSKKKKYLRKVEQNIMSGEGSGDAYQILERSRKHMLLLAILLASVTYQAGLNPLGGFWHGEATGTQYRHGSGDYRILHDKRRYLLFFCCNTSAFVVSLAIVLILMLKDVFSTRGIKYHCALQAALAVDLFCLIGAFVTVTLDWFCLIVAYVAGGIWKRISPVYGGLLIVWAIYVAIHVVVFLLQVLLGWAIWRQPLRETMEQCLPDWLKRLFGMSADEHAEEEEKEDGDDEEEDEEEAVAMELKLEHWRKLLLLLAILAAILAYHAITSAPPDNDLVNYRRLAFSYCKATVFIASLSIIVMLAKWKLPAARGVRWHAMQMCLVLDVIGLTGAFAARGYWKISTIDVIVLVLAVVLCIAFQVALSISGTPRGLLQSLLSKLGSPPVIPGPDPLQGDGTEHDLRLGITGGTNEEPLGVEIASLVLGGALTLTLAVPVISIVAIQVKLLVGILIASIGVGLWQRALARLLLPLARALQRRQGATSPTGSSSSSSTPPEQGLCRLIQTLCSETWMWIIILVYWVPSLRPNLRLNFRVSKILAVLSVLVDSTPAQNTTTGTAASATATAASTTTTATTDTPSTATSTVVGTLRESRRLRPSGTSMASGLQPLHEPRPRRNCRPNSRLIGPDWVN